MNKFFKIFCNEILFLNIFINPWRLSSVKYHWRIRNESTHNVQHGFIIK